MATRGIITTFCMSFNSAVLLVDASLLIEVSHVMPVCDDEILDKCAIPFCLLTTEIVGFSNCV